MALRDLAYKLKSSLFGEDLISPIPRNTDSKQVVQNLIANRPSTQKSNTGLIQGLMEGLKPVTRYAQEVALVPQTVAQFGTQAIADQKWAPQFTRNINQGLAQSILNQRTNLGIQNPGWKTAAKVGADTLLTGMTAYGAANLPKTLASTALGTGLGTGIAALQKQDIPTAIGKSFANSLTAQGLGALTAPFISPVVNKAVSLGGGKVINQVTGRTMQGLLNVAEDEFYAKLNGYTPGLGDRIASFGIGAIISPAANDALFKKVPLTPNQKRVVMEQTRDLRGRWAKGAGVSEKVFDYMVPSADGNHLVLKSALDKKYPSLANDLEKVNAYADKYFGGIGFQAKAIDNPNNPKLIQDVNDAVKSGNITPEEALQGFGVKVSGLTPTKKIKIKQPVETELNPIFKRGDITAIENKIDELIGTKSYMTKGNWKETLPARKTAMQQLDFEINKGNVEAMKVYQQVMELQDKLDIARQFNENPQMLKQYYDEFGKIVSGDPNTPKGYMESMGATLDQPPVTKLGDTPQLETQLQTSPTLPKSASQELLAKPLLEQQTGQIGRMSKLPDQEATFDNIIQQGKKSIGTQAEQDKRSIKQAADDFYTQWVDRYNPFSKAADVAKKKLKLQGAELRPEYDPTYTARKLTGAGGIADYRFNEELKPILNQMDEMKIDKGDLDIYLKARRDIGLSKRDIKGSDFAEAQKIIGAVEGKYGTGIKDLSQQLYEFQNKGFQEMIDAGFISPETGKIIKQANPDYVPFERIMDEMNDFIGLPTRKTMVGTQPIAKIKGSERKILSPLESIIANVYKQRAAIEKNNVAKSIVGLNDIAPELGFQAVKQSAPDTITVWNGGQKQYIKVGTDIANAAKGLNEENTNAILKILRAPASLLRQGATGRNPDFMIPNIIRDQLDAGVSSKWGYVPFVDYVSGLKSMISDDDVYKKWQQSGAKISLGEMSGRKTIKQSFDEKAAKKNIGDWLNAGLDWMGKYSEQPTRIGLFKKAYNKTGNAMLAMMESRDSTVDFARMGAKMKTANSIIPFLNVGVQGFDKLMRAVKDNPAKVATNATIYGVLPALMTTIYNITNHKEEFSEIPQYEKDTNFIFVSGRNKNGNVNYVKVPKGNIIPTIANPVESFLSYMADTSQQSFSEFANQFVSQALPVLAEGNSPKEIALKTIGANLPQAIKPITENLVNKSFYRFNAKNQDAREIVPFYMQNREPYQQYQEWTPQVYQKAGAALNVSPLQIQNLAEGHLAGFIKVPSMILESLNTIAKGENVKPSDLPIVRRMIGETTPGGLVKPPTQGPSTPFWERLGLASPVGAAETAVGTGIKIVSKKVDDNQIASAKWKMDKNNAQFARIGDSYYLVRKPNGDKGTVDLSVVTAMPETTKLEQITKEKAKLSLIDEIVSGLPKDEQTNALGQLGIKQEDAEYYYKAKLDTNTKSKLAIDELSKITDNDQRDEYLINGRQEVYDQTYLSNSVLDDLYAEGLISKEERNVLKGVKNGKSTKKSGSGSKKGKAISIKRTSFSIPKLGNSGSKVKPASVKISAPVVTRSKAAYKPKNITIAAKTTKPTFKVRSMRNTLANSTKLA